VGLLKLARRGRGKPLGARGWDHEDDDSPEGRDELDADQAGLAGQGTGGSSGDMAATDRRRMFESEEKWYEKLGQWKNALDYYDRRLKERQSDF